jgi:hypothetical protein
MICKQKHAFALPFILMGQQWKLLNNLIHEVMTNVALQISVFDAILYLRMYK